MRLKGISIIIVLLFAVNGFSDYKENCFEWLKSDNAFIKKQGINGLNKFKEPKVVEALTELYKKEPDSDIRLLIVKTLLVNLEDKNFYNLLFNALTKEIEKKKNTEVIVQSWDPLQVQKKKFDINEINPR